MNKIIKIEIDETYDLKDNVDVIDNDNIIKCNNSTIKGIKKGETKITVNKENISVIVVDKHALDSEFDLSYGRLSNKNLLVLGDSVSAQATIGEANKTYSTLLKEATNINNLHNAAIGGTTLTYMYEGSNIDKEYHNNSVAIDSCRVVNKLEEEGILKTFDYAIVAYGHNDQYFKGEIDEKNKNPKTLNDCHSFKNSFRYVINTLRNNNPNIRIIILNCTYSEYGVNSPSPYGDKYSYIDYRNASKEIAKEFNLKHIDPWNHMKQFRDYDTNAYYYKDSVHLSAKGHEELFKFLLNK